MTIDPERLRYVVTVARGFCDAVGADMPDDRLVQAILKAGDDYQPRVDVYGDRDSTELEQIDEGIWYAHSEGMDCGRRPCKHCDPPPIAVMVDPATIIEALAKVAAHQADITAAGIGQALETIRSRTVTTMTDRQRASFQDWLNSPEVRHLMTTAVNAGSLAALTKVREIING